MPHNPRIAPKQGRPETRLVRILAFPRVQLLDVSGPLQVFVSANEHLEKEGAPSAYRVEVVAEHAGGVMSSAGLGLQTRPLPAPDDTCDTLIVPGGKGVHPAASNDRLVAWVAAQATRCRRTVSVCTGAFLLAAAGLLDGRRAVTHWAYCEALARAYPAVTVDSAPVFIHQDNVWTSAGVTAGIDLALALVEADLGHRVALAVAQHLVVYLKRPGGQSQFSATLSMQQEAARVQDRFRELNVWMLENLGGNLSVPALAARAGMSERNFVRRYREQTGTTPAGAVRQLRIEAARRLLTETKLPVKRIADRCGFGSEETMRRNFLRETSVTPVDWRRRFATSRSLDSPR